MAKASSGTDSKDTRPFYFPEHNVTVQAVDREDADQQLKQHLKESSSTETQEEGSE